MANKFGEIDFNQILENEFRICILERTLDWIINNNSGSLRVPSEETLLEINREVVEFLQGKYPHLRIELNERTQQPVAG